MFKLNQSRKSRRVSSPAWGWLLPIVALAPLAFSGSGCINAGVIGDDCPTMAECAAGGSAGSGSGNVAGKGTVPADKTCGGLLPATCAKGQYCDYPSAAQCGAADQTGVCKATPEGCTTIYAPVCGCDDKTYSSACTAHAAGVSVAANGECDNGSGGSGNGSGGSSAGGASGGETCGGLTGKQCPDDQFCNYPVGAQCGAADQTGTCAEKPEACDLSYSAVCGCDGMTYGNACAAASAGVSVSKTGECGGTGKTCGGRSQGTCATTEYCNYQPGALCGRADATGTCTTIPKNSACPAIYAPVCGCDGMTYGNDCEAGLAGTGIDHTGACAKTCGGLHGDTCADGDFCNYPANMNCGITDGQGNCAKKPNICTDELAPVCGCDGKSYSTACTANAAGVSVKNQGACN